MARGSLFCSCLCSCHSHRQQPNASYHREMEEAVKKRTKRSLSSEFLCLTINLPPSTKPQPEPWWFGPRRSWVESVVMLTRIILYSHVLFS